MDFGRVFQKAPLGITSGLILGLENAPKLTFSLLAAGASLAVGDMFGRMESDRVMDQFRGLMRSCGPWQYGLTVAQFSQNSISRLPTDRPAVVMVDPYYFDLTMRYTDETMGEGDSRLFAYAYRMNPIGVFALNYNPTVNTNQLLTESVVLVAFMRGTSLYGKTIYYSAMWREGLPLGGECLFGIPRWGELRRVYDTASLETFKGMFDSLCKQALTIKTEENAVSEAIACLGAEKTLPTSVERGFPALKDTVWHGNEPFPLIPDAEYQMIGDDMRARGVTVPEWFRPNRGELG